MSFGNPLGLWLLALGVPILALHFYKGRIRKMAVPTLLFWEQVLVEEERRTALKRLRHYASLLLNLAALFLLTSAVAEPTLRPPARYAIILDNTASMFAVEADGRTRLAAAIESARGFVASLAHGDRVSLHDMAGPRAPFTADLDRLARGMTAPPLAPPGDLRARVDAALAAGDDVTAVLFTDRDPDDPRLRVVRVGASRDNVGWISGVPVRHAGEKKITLALSVANFSGSKAERTAVLSFNGRELERRKLELDADARRDIEWTLDPELFPGSKIEAGGRAEVALEPRDALALDDTASFVAPPLAPPAVVVFHSGKPNEFLMSALHALRAGGAVAPEIGQAPAERYAAVREQLGEGWIAIFDRAAPGAPLGRGGFLILGAPGGGGVERPTIADWDREAPPNRLVDYAGLGVRRSRILRGEPLLRAVEGPIATWSAGGGRAVVEFGFGLEDTNPLHLSFPVMLFNFVEWAAFRGTRSFRTEYRAGEPLRPDRPLWIEEGSIALGDEAVPVRRGQIVGAPPAAPGFIPASAAGRAEWIAVNLFDAAESDLRRPPAGLPQLPPPAPWHARLPYALLASAAVLALLLLEWWLHHRGAI